ncbi:hypothetical protein V8F20_001392 [Naviculisporaceae sp. PSN 640]
MSYLLYFLALAVCISTRLASWSMTSLTTFSPSGRPGSSPWAMVNTTITEPRGYYDAVINKVYPSTAVCFMKWDWLSETTTPYNIKNNCTNTDLNDTKSSWTFEMREVPKEESAYPSPTTYFYLWFWRTIESDDMGGHDNEKGGRRRAAMYEMNEKRAVKYITYVGSARFKVAPGENMEGLCSAGGICSFHLRGENTPFMVEKTRII